MNKNWQTLSLIDVINDIKNIIKTENWHNTFIIEINSYNSFHSEKLNKEIYENTFNIQHHF